MFVEKLEGHIVDETIGGEKGKKQALFDDGVRTGCNLSKEKRRLPLG